MTPPADSAAAVSPAAARSAPAVFRLPAHPLAAPILGHAVAVGVAADLLFHDTGPRGLGFALWVALCAAIAVSLVWRAGRTVPRETGAWLASAALFAAGLAWRDAGTLQLFDAAAALGSLGMAAVALRDPAAGLLARRLRDTAWAAAGLARSALAGVTPFALGELAAPPRRGRMPTLAAAARAALIGAAVLLVFGTLLGSADPIFASLFALPDLDVGEALSHVVLAAVFTWVAAGWARGALVSRSGRAAPDAFPFALGPADVTAALGTLVALFAAFVVAQLGWFFGGEQFLRERTGLTAAAYAREGFFQMVCVATLVVPVLVGTRAALRPGRALARRHTRLALPVLGLLGVMLVSAVLRMRLYVHYYGLTADRFYPLVFMGWLALVLGWLALTVLRDRGRPFAAGAALSGLATLAALNVAAPDAVVARVNLLRAERAGEGPAATAHVLDVAHLARLSAEATPLAVRALLAPPSGAPGSAARLADARDRCAAADVLIDHWGPASDAARDRDAAGAWRAWNAGAAAAVRVVRASLRPILAARAAACAHRAVRDDGDVEQWSRADAAAAAAARAIGARADLGRPAPPAPRPAGPAPNE